MDSLNQTKICKRIITPQRQVVIKLVEEKKTKQSTKQMKTKYW